MSIFLNPLLAQSLTLAQTKKHLPKSSVSSLLGEGSKDAFAKGTSPEASVPQFGIFADKVSFLDGEGNPQLLRQASLQSAEVKAGQQRNGWDGFLTDIKVVAPFDPKKASAASSIKIDPYLPDNDNNKPSAYIGYGETAPGINVTRPAYFKQTTDGNLEVFQGKDDKFNVSFVSHNDPKNEFLWYLPDGVVLEVGKDESRSKIKVGNIHDDTIAKLYGSAPEKIKKLEPSEIKNGLDANFIVTTAGNATRALPLSASYNKTAWPMSIDRKTGLYHSLPSYTIDQARQLGFTEFFIHTGRQNDRDGVIEGLQNHIQYPEINRQNPASKAKEKISIGEVREDSGSGTSSGLVQLIKSTQPNSPYKALEIDKATKQNTGGQVPFNLKKDTIIVAGDALVSGVQFTELLRRHRKNNASVSIAMVSVPTYKAGAFGTVLTDIPGESGIIRKFFEKSNYDKLEKYFKGADPTISTAIYTFSPETYPLIEAMYDYNLAMADRSKNLLSGTDQILDFGGEVMPILVQFQKLQELIASGVQNSSDAEKIILDPLNESKFLLNTSLSNLKSNLEKLSEEKKPLFDSEDEADIKKLKELRELTARKTNEKIEVEKDLKALEKEYYALERAVQLYNEGHRLERKNKPLFLYGQKLDEGKEASEYRNKLIEWIEQHFLAGAISTRKIKAFLKSKEGLGQWDDLGDMKSFALQISNLSKTIDSKRYESIVKDNVLIWPGAESLYKADKTKEGLKVHRGVAILAPRKLPIEN